MNQKFIILIVILSFFSTQCNKTNKGNTRINIQSPVEQRNVIVDDNSNYESETLQETAGIPVPEGVQEIIENYATSILKFQRVLALQIEGNFTGSGKREIIGFYGSTPEASYGNITEVFCFVIDSEGGSIDNVYAIDYLTGEFYDIKDSEIGLSEDLGKPVIWRNRVIGRYGDFNENGKDELYLFIYATSSVLLFRPYFFEFNGNEFKKILDFDSSAEDEITILDIDPEKKIIFLKGQAYVERTDYQKFEIIYTYVWDETTQMYELLSKSELKYFRWNRGKYEEIER